MVLVAGPCMGRCMAWCMALGGGLFGGTWACDVIIGGLLHEVDFGRTDRITCNKYLQHPVNTTYNKGLKACQNEP